MDNFAAAPTRAPAPIIPFPSSDETRTRSQVTPWGQPTLGFWSSLKAAQADVQPMVKGEEFPDKKGKHFSRTEDWIKAGRDYFLKYGLIGSQVGAILVEGAGGPVLATQFLLVSSADGTGLLCSVDWPVYGFGGGKGSPGHGTAAAFTGAWKYWVRGILAIPQVDEGEEFEQRDGSIDNWDARKKNEAAGRAYQAPPQQPARQPDSQLLGAQFPAQQRQAAQPQSQPQWYQDPATGQWYHQDPATGQWLPHVQESPTARASFERLYDTQPQRPEIDPRTAQLPPQPQGPTSAAMQGAPSEPVPQVNQAPPQRPAPLDGGPDPTFEQLRDKGWAEIFARHLAAIGPNEAIPDQLRDQFLNEVNTFFAGQNEAAFAAWAGTGFTPSGPGGPKPTGAQLRRYALKLEWNKRAAAGAGR